MRKTFSIIIVSLLLVLTVFAGCSTPQAPVQDTNSSTIEEPEEKPNEEKIEEIYEETKNLNEETKDPVPSVGQLKAHFINVGQGDSILIQTPEQNVLIDAGEYDAGVDVVKYLRNHNVNSLDLVIGTHAHSDHIGGLIQVLGSIPVKEVIDPGVVHTTKTFEDYLTLIDNKDIEFTEGRAGMTRGIGGATMQILHPFSPSSSSLNDSSNVVKITFGDISFLLTGDVEHKSESEMLARKEPLESTILKVPHHGSSFSSSLNFIKAVNPEVAVIMCGKDNSYGHPHEETLQTYADQGIDIYRTDLHGTIVIITDGQTFDINEQPYMHTLQKEPGPDEAVVSSGFVGSIKSDKYHKPGCKHAGSIKPENKITFSSIEEAKSKGYSPCKVCNPPN